MGLFELGYVGLPCALIGGAFLIFLAPRLLPNRTDIVEQLGEQRREYLVEMLVQQDCPLIGSTVEEAGLRQLPGLFLIEIDRNGEVITPVTPQDTDPRPRPAVVYGRRQYDRRPGEDPRTGACRRPVV